MSNALPNELIEAIKLLITFTALFGIILILLFSKDKPSTNNLYLKKGR